MSLTLQEALQKLKLQEGSLSEYPARISTRGIPFYILKTPTQRLTWRAVKKPSFDPQNYPFNCGLTAAMGVVNGSQCLFLSEQDALDFGLKYFPHEHLTAGKSLNRIQSDEVLRIDLDSDFPAYATAEFVQHAVDKIPSTLRDIGAESVVSIINDSKQIFDAAALKISSYIDEILKSNPRIAKNEIKLIPGGSINHKELYMFTILKSGSEDIFALHSSLSWNLSKEKNDIFLQVRAQTRNPSLWVSSEPRNAIKPISFLEPEDARILRDLQTSDNLRKFHSLFLKELEKNNFSQKVTVQLVNEAYNLKYAPGKFKLLVTPKAFLEFDESPNITLELSFENSAINIHSMFNNNTIVLPTTYSKWFNNPINVEDKQSIVNEMKSYIEFLTKLIEEIAAAFNIEGFIQCYSDALKTFIEGASKEHEIIIEF